jgi:hypothetical protein
MNRDDLERALADQFDAEHLSVYGDYLQSIGDPRGDLIAFDLSELDDARRRDQLIAEWLGGATTDLLATATIELGFITDLYLDGDDLGSARRLDAILAGPGAPYLRGVTIRGGAVWTQLALRKLVTRPHVWLQRLSIQVTRQTTFVSTLQGTLETTVQRTVPLSSPVVTDALATSLSRATPRLEQLEVWGRHVFGELAHDALRSLCVTGYDAVGSLLGTGGARLPAVAVLDLAFHVEGDGVPVDRNVLDIMLAPERLPRLRRLDLSRNEPGTVAPHYLGGRIDASWFFAHRAVRRQLTHVRLPSVRSQDQADRITSAVADMAALRELSIVRSYRRLPHVTLPSIAAEPTPFTWLPANLAAEVLHAEVPTAGFLLPLPPLVLWLEQYFEALPVAVRTTWLELFDSLSYYQGRPGTEVSRRSALDALAALDAEAPDAWLRLRAAVEELDDGDRVLFDEL